MRLSARAIAHILWVPLILTIVAPDSLNLAIAETPVRAHLDKFHNNHSSGDANNSGSCSSFHKNKLSVRERTADRLDSVPPLGERFCVFGEKWHPLKGWMP